LTGKTKLFVKAPNDTRGNLSVSVKGSKSLESTDAEGRSFDFTKITLLFHLDGLNDFDVFFNSVNREKGEHMFKIYLQRRYSFGENGVVMRGPLFDNVPSICVVRYKDGTEESFPFDESYAAIGGRRFESISVDEIVTDDFGFEQKKRIPVVRSDLKISLTDRDILNKKAASEIRYSFNGFEGIVDNEYFNRMIVVGKFYSDDRDECLSDLRAKGAYNKGGMSEALCDMLFEEIEDHIVSVQLSTINMNDLLHYLYKYQGDRNDIALKFCDRYLELRPSDETVKRNRNFIAHALSEEEDI
jgi:hypothetical protein